MKNLMLIGWVAVGMLALASTGCGINQCPAGTVASGNGCISQANLGGANGFNNGWNNGFNNGGWNNGWNNGFNGGFNNGWNNGFNGGWNNGWNQNPAMLQYCLSLGFRGYNGWNCF